MRENGLAGIRLRRRVRTTIPDQTDETFPDLMSRDFTAAQINQKYVGDITYLPLADGTNMYLATVIDCCSRKLAGWALADHMRTELVEEALTAAHRTRGSLRGAIFHSDHGSVYTSKAYTARCQNLGVTQSMGRVGTFPLTGYSTHDPWRRHADEHRVPRSSDARVQHVSHDGHGQGSPEARAA